MEELADWMKSVGLTVDSIRSAVLRAKFYIDQNAEYEREIASLRQNVWMLEAELRRHQQEDVAM